MAFHHHDDDFEHSLSIALVTLMGLLFSSFLNLFYEKEKRKAGVNVHFGSPHTITIMFFAKINVEGIFNVFTDYWTTNFGAIRYTTLWMPRSSAEGEISLTKKKFGDSMSDKNAKKSFSCV